MTVFTGEPEGGKTGDKAFFDRLTTGWTPCPLIRMRSRATLSANFVNSLVLP